MPFLKMLVIGIWFCISFGIGFVYAIFRWGNTSSNYFVSKLFAYPILKLFGIRIEIDGIEGLEKHQPCIYVANHQGSLDILTFGSFYPKRTVIVAKKEIAYLPFLNLYFVAAGNVLINRQRRESAVASLGKVIRKIRKKDASVWVFPEGTRNRTEELILPLKKGAFYMAIEAQIPIVPVISAPIRGLVDLKGNRLPGGVLKMKVLPPISTLGLKAVDVSRLAEEVRGLMIEAVRGLSV